MRVEASGHLPVAPEEAWRVLLRWEDQPRWIPDAASVRVLTPRREGLGVRIAVRSRVYHVPLLSEVLEVTRWEPPHRLEMTHRSVIRGIGTWALDREEGGSRFTWVEDVALPIPVLGALALRVYRPFQRRMMREAVAELARTFGSASRR